MARLRLDGRHLGGDLAWSLAADTGELRRRRDRALVAALRQRRLAERPDRHLRRHRGHAGGPRHADGEAVLLSNGRPLADEAQATWLLREAANLAGRFGRAGFATLRAGLARFTVADGLVHDDDATGLDLALDLGALGPPVALRLAAAYVPTRDLPWRETFSPLLLVEAAWQVSLFDRVGLFAAARRDRADGVAQAPRRRPASRRRCSASTTGPRAPSATAAQSLYLTRVLFRPPTSDATLAWVGLSGTLRPWRGQRLTFTGALSGGPSTAGRSPRATPVLEDVPLSGQAASVRWAASPADWLTVTPWFLYLSGDHAPDREAAPSLSTGATRGFLGVTPLVTATNLFFQGGVSEASPRARSRRRA